MEAHTLSQEGTARFCARVLRTGLLCQHARVKAVGKDNTHDALLLKRNDSIFDPHAIAAYDVGEHHVSGQSISNDSDLVGAGNASLGMLLKVLHNLRATAGLLGLMREHYHAGGLFEFLGQLPFWVVAESAGCV